MFLGEHAPDPLEPFLFRNQLQISFAAVEQLFSIEKDILKPKR